MAKDAPRIEKPCEQCKEPMYCTANRKICSVCRKENEKQYKRQKKEQHEQKSNHQTQD